MSDTSIVRVCDLPSRGFFYGDKLPGGRVDMSPMRTSDEKLLAGGVSDRAALIDTLLKRCIITEFPYNEYMIGDKYYMLMFLRSITYGDYYEFKMTCGKCAGKFSHGMNVPDDFEMTVSTEDDNEEFDVKLPVSNKTVTLRLLRVNDENELAKHVRREGMRSGVRAEGDPAYIQRIARSIVSIDGQQRKPLEVISFVEDLYGKDSLAIRNELENNDPGVDMLLNVDCPHCGTTIEEMMPFTTEFFRPKST